MVKPTNTKFNFPLQKKLQELTAAGGEGGGPGVSDHGALTGLADDDHLLYHTDTRGDTRYYTKAQVDSSLSGKANTSHSHVIADTTGLQTALDGKQAAGSYAAASHTHVTGDVTGLDTALSGKQATLVSGTNIKTINSTSLLGSGDIAISGGATNLGYTAATRILTSDTGTDVTLPLVTSGDAGLAPASGGGTTNFLRADLTWAAPGGGSDPWTYVSLGSDFTTSLTANTAVTGLFFTPAASTTYEIEGMFLLRTATTTVGARPGASWPTGYTDGAVTIRAPNSNTAAAFQYRNAGTTANAASTGLPLTTGSYLGDLKALLIMGGSPSGNFQVTLATETGATNVTMRAGSFIRYRAI